MTKKLTLFAAAKPPTHILKIIARLQKNIDGARWVPPENLHVTLGYFGLVDREFAEILDRELASSAGGGAGGGFKLSLTGANVFGSSRPHTLWLGIAQSPELLALHNHVRKAARRAHIEMEIRNYTPHISLAYMRGGISLMDLTRFIRKHINFTSKPFIVDQFTLYSSNPNKSGRPNIYVKEANYPLLGR